MRDFTPEELETVKRMAGDGKSRAETRKCIKIGPHNFAANVRALDIVFQPSTLRAGPPRRTLTASEIHILRTLADEGHTKSVAFERLTIGTSNFERLIKEHGIVFAKRQNPPPVTKRSLSPDQEAEFRRLAPKATRPYLAAKFGISISTVARFYKDFDIKKERPVAAPKPAPTKKKHNPLHILQQWKPPAAVSDIEAAVTKLRRKYPVFAESTLRQSRAEPKAYTVDTVFMVGSKRMTGAEILEAAA